MSVTGGPSDVALGTQPSIHRGQVPRADGCLLPMKNRLILHATWMVSHSENEHSRPSLGAGREQGWTRARGQPQQANNLAPSKRYSLNICQHSSRGEAGCCVAGEDTEECWFSTHPLAARLPALNTPYPAAKRPGRQPRHHPLPLQSAWEFCPHHEAMVNGLGEPDSLSTRGVTLANSLTFLKGSSYL